MGGHLVGACFLSEVYLILSRCVHAGPYIDIYLAYDCLGFYYIKEFWFLYETILVNVVSLYSRAKTSHELICV